MADSVLEPVDLLAHMRAGVEHIYAALDRRQSYRPYFGWNALEPPLWARHTEGGDTPHTTGRFLDALARCNAIAPMPGDAEADAGLAALLYSAFTEDDLAYNPPSERSAAVAGMHNNREVLLALIGLHRWRHDTRALPRARRLVRKLEVLSRPTGVVPGMSFDGKEWTADTYQVTATIGRAISALLLYADVSGDEAGVELAERFAKATSERCFTPEGTIKNEAERHLHSIEGTTTGLIEIGIKCGKSEYFQLGKNLYDRGLRPYRMATGWAQEGTVWKQEGGRGEANNTTDFIEAAYLLAREGSAGYYEDAERMVRNGLIRYQILRTDWMPASIAPADTEEYTYCDIARRIRGAFCFATPSDFHSYNSDLTGGALQGLCETWHNAVTSQGIETQVNLFFSRTDDRLEIKSQLPREGRLEIRVKEPMSLAVRVPSWAQSVRAVVDGTEVPCEVDASYLALGRLPADASAEVLFGLPQDHEMTETVAPGTYRTRWRADTVLEIDPPGKVMPLYGGTEAPSDRD